MVTPRSCGPCEVAIELARPCAACAWRVQSTAATWRVSELRMFASPSCTGDPLPGYGIADKADCDGIAVVTDGSFGQQWCGEPTNWIGLSFEGETDVKCVLVSGDASADDFSDVALQSKLGTGWETHTTWAVLAESSGVVTAELRPPCAGGTCACVRRVLVVCAFGAREVWAQSFWGSKRLEVP